MRDFEEVGTQAAETASAPKHDPIAKDDPEMPTSKSTRSPAFQFYPKDFLGDEEQTLMSLPEVGAYIRLMSRCWLKGSLPPEVPELARLCGATTGQMRKFWPAISKCFNQRADGRWIHPRLEKERKVQADYRKRQKENADKRWQSHGNATAMPEAPHPVGNALLSSSSSSISNLQSSKKNTDNAVIGSSLDVAFGAFQEAYPPARRKGGYLIQQTFVGASITAGGASALLAALENHKASEQWQNPKLIPGMDTWLTEERWRQTLPAVGAVTPAQKSNEPEWVQRAKAAQKAARS